MVNNLPFITIIMPVRNEANFISRSLGAVLAQEYPRALIEVLVADGMSTDGTRKTVEALQAEHANLRLIDNSGKIVPVGINAALRQAKGDIIVRVDGHCEIAPDYVMRSVTHLLEADVDGVGGRLIP
jgi:succinoglycan biosynthesis protein ExoA